MNISFGRAERLYDKHGWLRIGAMISELDTPEGVFSLEVWRYEKRLTPSVTVKSHHARG
jgi:hypothetical protein